MQLLRLPVLFTWLVVYANLSIAQSGKNNIPLLLNQYMQRYVNNGDFSGNMLVVKDNKVLFRGSYGKADYELNTPMGKENRFRIASVSKTFTAAAIVLLANNGQLNYTDKLSRYIPNFINGDSISVEQLLLHQSGVADIDYDKYALDRLSLNETINTIKDKPLYFKPGTQSRYSNSGYLLLAAIIEKVSGASYEQFIRQHIFSKLGMVNSGVDYCGKIIQGKAVGYGIGSGAIGIAQASWYDINLETGSGSLYSTTDDLLKWLQAIKNKTLFDAWATKYFYGWGNREYFKGKKSIEQSGFLNGYSSYISLYPSENLCIVVLSNISSNFNEQSGRDLAAICFNETYQLPVTRKEVSAGNLDVYTGKYSWPGYKDFFIEKKGDGINWRFVDEKNGSPLAPVSEDLFLLRLTGNQIMFTKEPGNKVTSLGFISGKDKTTCKKID